MHKEFASDAIEKKWQAKWQTDGLYNVGDRDKNKEKEYVLVEWPYPSGNLHIGHWYAFAVPDIYVRFKRMLGKQVLYPIGFDAFGLPAENAAIKRDIDPKKWTSDNISHMRTQLISMGNAFSWDKTTNSTNIEYYRWTQLMFTIFFANDIAYRGQGIVNWCPSCNTAIANEQVLSDGTCERSGDLIEKREMPQWMLRITKYADRLVDDLETVKWPEHIKEAQKQWIGRSRGVEIDFRLSNDDIVTVFTTRPDTLFGTTHLVLAPEHPLVEKNKNQIRNWKEVTTYCEDTKKKMEQERLNVNKKKTGVLLCGITATNPISGEVIPIYISDYILANYGTGAIMAVPAHDERDFAFAKKFGIEVKQVISGEKQLPFSDGDTLINSGEFNGLDLETAKDRITKRVKGKVTATYRLRDWSIGRQRYWGVPIPIVYSPEGKAHIIPKEHLPWLLPEDVDFRPTGEAPLAKSKILKERTERIFGAGWTPEVETMDTFVDSSWYFLRYLDNHNDESLASLEKQKDWMPIDIYFGGAEHTTMHLLYSRFWQKALFDLGLVTENEPYKRRVNRGLILGPDGNKMSKSKGNVIDPDKQVKAVGADTVKMYLAFMGPYEGNNYPFDLGGIAGVRRFLERVYGLGEQLVESEEITTTKLLHKTITKVTDDITNFKFNTAISALMIFVNHAEKTNLTRNSYLTLIKLLAPFAPHLSEEIWAEQGEIESIHKTKFPESDLTLLTETEIKIGVQINGKIRGTILLAPDSSEAEAVNIALKDKNISKYTTTGNLKKIVYVRGKILSLIVTA